MPKRTTILDIMESRAQMYALLSRLFLKEVDAGLVERFRTMPIPPESGNAEVDEGYRLILTYIQNNEDSLHELAIDYAHTFIGSGTDGHAAAYPYESVYTSEKRLIMQKAYHEVINEYLEAGYRKTARKEPDDHIGIEFEFMGLLCEKTRAAFDSDRESAETLIRRQATFARNHLANWIDNLSTEMSAFSQTDFYRGLALLAKGFVISDEKLLSSLIEPDNAG